MARREKWRAFFYSALVKVRIRWEALGAEVDWLVCLAKTDSQLRAI